MNKRAQSTSIRRQCLTISGSVLTLSLALVPSLMSVEPNGSEEQTLEPLPTLPPLLRDGPAIPGPQRSDRPTTSETPQTEPTRSVDRASLVADINALRQDVARVRRSLESQDPLFSKAFERENEQRQENAAVKPSERPGIQAEGDPIISTRLGSNSLSIQRYRNGEQRSISTVTADITGERVERVYREMLFLLGKSVDESALNPARRMVNVHIDDMPWNEALTKLLRQVDLDWKIRGYGALDSDSQIIIYEVGDENFLPDPKRMEAEALAALRKASTGANDAVAAQARYLLAEHDAKRAESMRRENGGSDDTTWRSLHYSAISAYADLIQEFDTGSRSEADSLPWVRKAMLGIGSSMEAVGMFREAYGVYRNYIVKADANDPQLPRVMLAAANAARQQHLRAINGDTSDLEIATTLLGDLITKYGNNPRLLAIVSEAHLELGRLYFQQGEYEAAKAELLKHALDAGENLSHQIHFMIAECDIEIGKRMRGSSQESQELAEIHLTNAQHRLDGLQQALFSNGTDPLLDADLYRQALYKLGTVHMLRAEPDYVSALHMFLRARQRFPNSEIEGQLLVSIARCYAETHGSTEHIAHIWELLRNENLLDNRDVQFQLDEMITDLQTRVGNYPGAIAGRIRFYLAQYHHRLGLQNPQDSVELNQKAIQLYERVLREGPPQYLAQSARLGLARAALAAGDESRARSTLRDVLEDTGAHQRDKLVASQILGNYYYEKGMYREAIEAYDGGVSQ